MFDELKEGYTGGATDLYIPYSDKPVYCYDVNSLYPTVMAEMDMPVGNIKFFEGDITKIEPNAFGFFECKITAPDNLHKPILQTRVKTGSGERTMAPLGT